MSWKNAAIAVALMGALANGVAAAEAPAAFRQCAPCHSTVSGSNGVGPSLAGVYGSKAGSRPGYKYSDKMVTSGLTWDFPTLAKFLADPKGTVSGSKMAFAGLKRPDDVAAIIEYLKTLR